VRKPVTHAPALIGEYLFESLAHIPVEVEYASEFRYRNPPMDRNTVVLALTQSGETADNPGGLARVPSARATWPWPCCNVLGSTIAREADGCVYLLAGPEIGVASTKALHGAGGGADACSLPCISAAMPPPFESRGHTGW